MMGTSGVVKGRNSQAVQKAEASMVNTTWIRIKTASQSVNGCSIEGNLYKRVDSYKTRRQRLDNTMREIINLHN